MNLNKIKIIIVDDHKVLREGYISMLKEESNFKIIGDVNNGLELIETLQFNQPDLILLDIEMPLMNGYQALEIIKETYPTIKVIIISMYSSDLLTYDFIIKGANSFINKSGSIEEIIKAINSPSLKSHFFVMLYK